MSNHYIAAALAAVGLLTWVAPGFNGFLFDAGDVSDGEAQIAGAVFIVGAAIVWVLRR